MAIGNASLTLNILADDRVLKRVLADAKKNVTTFSKDVEKTNARASASTGALGGAVGRGGKLNQGLRGLASGTGLGSAALFGSGAFIGSAISAAAIKKSVDAASALNEQITKSQQIFGSSAKVITNWSKSTAKDIGISRDAALAAAGTFGNLFKAQGFGDLENSKLSKGLVNLAGDLASFNDVDTSQVLQDLQSGIVGEIEPVRKYGADLRVARVQQQALAESGKDNVKQLTAQELTLARLHLLYKDTAAAQGDFKRTSGGLANQQRALSAQVNDLAANLGTLLLPAVTVIVTSLNDLVEAANLGARALQTLSHVEIPPIKIPFFFDFPGLGGGGKKGKPSAIGKIAKQIGISLFSPFAGLIEAGKNLHQDDLKGFEQFQQKSLKKFSAASFGSKFFKSPIDQSLKLNGFFQVFQGKSAKKNLSSLIDSLNLGLDRSDLTSTASDNIAILKDLVVAYKAEIHAGVDVKNARKQLIATQKDLQTAAADQKATGFSNILDSLQLGVEKSQVTGSVQAQLGALGALKAGIEKQIKAGVDVQSAQHQLVAVTGQIADLQKQQTADGFAKIIGSLQLGVDKSSLTKGLGDDLKALEGLRDGLKSQIKAGVDVANNQSQLVGVLQNIKALREEIAQNSKDAVKASAFKQIGLSATGGEIIPGVGNLKKQLEQLNSNDLSSVPKKLANRLKGVGKVLSDPIKSSIPEVRSAIKDLFSAIRDELNNQSKGGPLTKTTSLNPTKLLKGLGLDPAQVKALSGRLSTFNSAGVALAGGGVVQSAGSFIAPASGGDINVTVELDGEKMEKKVTVRQQKRSRRNPKQKRGPTVHNI